MNNRLKMLLAAQRNRKERNWGKPLLEEIPSSRRTLCPACGIEIFISEGTKLPVLCSGCEELREELERREML